MLFSRHQILIVGRVYIYIFNTPLNCHVWCPLQIQLSQLNVCPSVGPPANPLCISNDTSNISFEDRVCSCQPQCQAPPTLAPPTSVSPVVIGVVAGGGGALLVAIIITAVCCWCYKRRKSKMAVDQKTSVVEPLNSGSPNSTSTKSTKTSQKSSQEVDGPSSVVSISGSKASDG